MKTDDVSDNRTLLNTVKARFGPRRAGTSVFAESFFVQTFYSFIFVSTQLAQSPTPQFDIMLTLPFKMFAANIVPSPLPVLMIVVYFVLSLLLRNFERSTLLYFVTGITASMAASSVAIGIDSAAYGSLMGPGLTGDSWWLLIVMVIASVLVRALRLSVLARRESSVKNID
ncbi:MAG: hypothetical protein WBA28_07670 [Microbacteriaceae bacterium]